VHRAVHRAQRSLDLHTARCCAPCWWTARGQQRLLIAIHHLVVDGVSWRVLLEDLQNVYRQLSEGQSVSLPAKTSALRDWAARVCRPMPAANPCAKN
jgi:NRPS condensation-like uncharacterized protein